MLNLISITFPNEKIMSYKRPTSFINEFGTRIVFPAYTMFQKVKKDSDFTDWDDFADFYTNGYPLKRFENLPHSRENTLLVVKEIYDLYHKVIPKYTALPPNDLELIKPSIVARFARILAVPDLDAVVCLKLQRDMQKWKV